MAYTFVGQCLLVVDENMCACCAQQVLSVFDVLHHFGEKTKINLDFGRFCIIFVRRFEKKRACVLCIWGGNSNFARSVTKSITP